MSLMPAAVRERRISTQPAPTWISTPRSDPGLDDRPRESKRTTELVVAIEVVTAPKEVGSVAEI